MSYTEGMTNKEIKVDLILLENIIAKLQKESKLYGESSTKLYPSSINASNTKLNNYINDTNNILKNLVLNINELSSYLSSYKNDVNALEKKITGKGTPISDSSINQYVSRYVFSIERANIDDGKLFNINTYNINGTNFDAGFAPKIYIPASPLIATQAVIATSIASGVLKLGEYVVDGGAWLGGTAVSGIQLLFGNEEASKKTQEDIMNFISRDLTDEANKEFYENTLIGKTINDLSYIKYDSNTAKKIQNVTTDVAYYAALTGATIATGGAAAPLFAMGFLKEAGKSAEESFKSEDRDFWLDSINIGVNGTAGGIYAVATGRSGAKMVEGVKKMVSAGVKSTIDGAKQSVLAFNKYAIRSTIKNSGSEIFKTAALNTVKDKDYIIGTAADVVNRTVNCIKLKDELTFDIIADNAKGAAVNSLVLYGINFVGNFTGTFSEGVMDYYNKIDNLKDLYDQGQMAAVEKYGIFFKNFREHADGHVYSVADYAERLSKGNENVNSEEIIWGALTHDIGMKGGVGFVEVELSDDEWNRVIGMNMDMGFECVEEFDYDKGKMVKKLKGIVDIDRIGIDGDTMVSEMPEYKKLLYAFDNSKGIDKRNMKVALTVRKNHPLNSALSILNEDVVPDGVDRDVVSVLAMSHSKSTSGIKSIATKEEWLDCVDKLEAAIKNYNEINGSDISFNGNKIRNLINDNDSFARLQSEALIIRDADAMSEMAKAGKNAIMQDGGVSILINHNKRGNFDIPVDKGAELDGIEDILKYSDGRPDDIVNNNISKKIHAGELNVVFDSKYSTGKATNYSATISLNEPTEVPYSSMEAIKERLGEVVTYTNCDSRNFTIILPKEAEGSKLANYYQKALDDFKEENLGLIMNKYGDEILKKQIEFFDKGLKIVFK